jgi:hypothetical protein
MTKAIPERALVNILPDRPSQPKKTILENLINNGRYIDCKTADGQTYHNGVVVPMRAAQRYVGARGVIASMPLLIAGKALADRTSYLWDKDYTTLSEENVGMDRRGIFSRAHSNVVLIVHGGGLLTADRLAQAYARGLNWKLAAMYQEKEFENILSGILPDGNNLEIYTVDEVKRGNVPDPFGRYGVVIDYSVAVESAGTLPLEKFVENPLVLARAGTPEFLEDYFDKANRSGEVNNSHSLQNIVWDNGRLLWIKRDRMGLCGETGLDVKGRFVGVKEAAYEKH